jgi:RNA polymerase sigma factor (sigma-70 family)
MAMRRKRRYGLDLSRRGAAASTGGESDAAGIPLRYFRSMASPMIERVRIGAALSRLPIGYQKVLELHDIQGHTHEEIAKMLGIQTGTSKSQLYKARLRMRLLL